MTTLPTGWFYLGITALVVVVGVAMTIFFAIDNWNEDRKARKAKKIG